MKDELDEMEDDKLYENYEAYKALLDAGVAKNDALKKTGLTAQIVKDFEEEFEDEEFKSEFKEVWGQDDEDFKEDDWKEESFADDDEWSEDDAVEDGEFDDYESGSGGYDDSDY